ncbi:MAG: AMP-binding protein [Christensenellales bacterium]
MNLLKNYLSRTDFQTYEDFTQNFHINVPADFNFGYDVVDEYARITPDKIALVWCNDKGEERVFTFAEISKLSNKVANALINLGIKKGDFVMSMLNRRYEYWLLIIALHKIGAIIIPATHLLRGKDISYRIDSASVKAIVAMYDDEILDSVDSCVCPSLEYKITLGDKDGWLNFHTIMDAASDNLERIPNKTEDLMLVYFTSGTTGYPKMVAHDHSYGLGHIITAKYWHDCIDDGLHLSVAETGWGKAAWGKLYGQWICGSAVFVYDYNGKFAASDLLPLMQKYKVTTFCAPPTIYRFLIREDLSKYDFSNIRHCTTAGEALNPEVFKLFYNLTGLNIKEGFGQTESVLMLGTYVYTDAKPGSMGKPSPLYDVYLADDDENPVPNGVEGEICVRLNKNTRSFLFSCYYRDEELTDKAFRTGVYHTGDLAYKDEDGYYWFVGRKDDIIKSSGYRIGPFEVESALMEHPAVLECAITAVPDEVRGQIVKATIVLTRNYSPSDELVKELQNHVKKLTAPYKYPRIIEFVDSLPKTISGKIRRVELRNKDNNK